MAGVRTSSGSVNDTIQGYSNAAVTAAQILWEYVSPVNGRIGAIVADAGTAGVGAGNTVLDVLVNGTSVFTAAANQPTIATASTGPFTNTLPDPSKGGIRFGDVIQLKVTSIPATTGHARVKITVALVA